VENYRLRDRPDARVNRFAPSVARGPLRPFLAYQLLYTLTPDPSGPSPVSRGAAP
jgi:hypothetical protein